jgi:hypothetical protein
VGSIPAASAKFHRPASADHHAGTAPIAEAQPAAYHVGTSPAKGLVMKKLLVILILIAIGVAVAKKVRDTA